MVDLFDWYLGITEQKDWFAGNAQWAFKDFGTPLRPENAIPYINQKGLVDRAGNPKDAYYVFKSYWATTPFAYIESHTWTERSGPEGKARNIAVFSNAESVELSLNGVTQGKKMRQLGQFPACVLDYEDRCYFTLLDGNSDLLKHYGTPTRSQQIEMANGQASIELVPAMGRTVVEARNQDFKGSYTELKFVNDKQLIN